MLLGFRSVYNYIRMKKHELKMVLSPSEEMLFSTLLTYTRQLQLTTVMRVAGGWVRDKIMGKQSHDIDIALDNCKGEEFVKLLMKHAQSKNDHIKSFGVTKLNPDLSKHLQTATASIHGNKIDFVHLREEKYTDQSRIPTVQDGTPLTDSLRRDFTMNSLFYNINTGEIQDFTQRGISDLQNGILRTPLDPLVTFKDDPLRVFRCFRFKARFDFQIHQDIYKSLEDKHIHENLKHKVSKERIGIETAGILKAKHVLQGLQLILKYNFWNIIFQIPEHSDLKDLKFIENIPEYSFNLLKEGLKSLQVNCFITQKQLILNEYKDKRVRYSEDELKTLVNLSFLTVVYRNYKAMQGKKVLGLIDHIVRRQLKYSLRDAKFCQKIGQLINQVSLVLKQTDEQKFKIKVIKWLRQAAEKWQIVLHILHAMCRLQQLEGLNFVLQPLQLRSYILQNKFQDSYLVQSFIDGHFLVQRGKKGPIMTTIIKNSIIWKILHPEADKQTFIKFYEQNKQFFENANTY